MAFLTPLALLAGLLAIPIILLYMLRLRRREVRVSSSFLWQQVLRDREANTPWQKLRRNLLLLLQLLILALLVLALARPYVTVPAITAGQIALLLDASASMNATDADAGTRFAEAQRRAHAIIDTMNAGDRMTIIRVADVPEVLTGYSDDAALLHSAVDAARPSNAPADWTAAFTLAAAGGVGAEDFNVVIVSDGGLGAAADFPPIPGSIEYVPIGASDSNLAITALAARALPGETPQLFAEITNYAAEDAEVIFSLNVDGALFSAERYTVPARARLPVVSSALPADYETLQAALTLPAGSTFVDHLPTDDTAYTVSPGTDVRRVLLITDGNRFVEQVLRSLPGIRTFQGSPERGLPAGDFDLVVFDGWLPPTLPNRSMLIINPPQSTPLFTVGELTEQTSDIRVNRSDPRMTFVDFDSVNLFRFRSVQADWADALITAAGGPLLLAGETNGHQVALLTFDLRDSDLPLQITFPILIASLMEWFAPEAFLPRRAFSVGEPVALRLPTAAEELRVILPDGGTRPIPLEANPIYGDTAQPGLYKLEVVLPGGQVEHEVFAVNLFAAQESDITPAAALTLGATEITPEVEAELGQQEFWPWLALIALIVLLVEWYAYHRRTRTPLQWRSLAARGGR